MAIFLRSLLILFTSTSITTTLWAQDIIGAWEATTLSEDGVAIKNVVIFSEHHQVATWYEAETGAFIRTNGGLWSSDGNRIIETVEFDTSDPDRVGTEISFEIYFDGDTMGVVGEDYQWKRIDNGQPGALRGAWLMSGRVRDGETRMRDTDRPRKTMKILSGTRFQWIAYNTETKQFMGTGGGAYTTVDGRYTEHIEFFSRDNSRVGNSLEFDYDLRDGLWHHQGFSSKGDPMHEIWKRRN